MREKFKYYYSNIQEAWKHLDLIGHVLASLLIYFALFLPLVIVFFWGAYVFFPQSNVLISIPLILILPSIIATILTGMFIILRTSDTMRTLLRPIKITLSLASVYALVLIVYNSGWKIMAGDYNSIKDFLLSLIKAL